MLLNYGLLMMITIASDVVPSLLHPFFIIKNIFLRVQLMLTYSTVFDNFLNHKSIE